MMTWCAVDDLNFDETRERIQKSLNQAKKREIEEKYGARFSKEESAIPPDVESEWLNYIEEFERQFENAKRVTVRGYLGFPLFKPISEIAAKNLAAELDDVLVLLDQNDISVDCLADVSDEDLYQFITTELINEEIDDMRIEGMMTCFIYEEFHPNDDYDARRGAEHFLWDLFERYEDYVVERFAEDEKYDPSGKRISAGDLKSLFGSFYRRHAAFTFQKFECLECELDGEYATVRLEGRWSGILADSLTPVSHEGVAEIRMKKSPYGGYDVIRANIPGFVGT
ncbi:MAG TPA: hypothetical protein DEP53_14285 [Bacteroidetes bacterium]|nr:hypothetical protein [Bacteroidota bacterium]